MYKPNGCSSDLGVQGGLIKKNGRSKFIAYLPVIMCSQKAYLKVVIFSWDVILHYLASFSWSYRLLKLSFSDVQ